MWQKEWSINVGHVTVKARVLLVKSALVQLMMDATNLKRLQQTSNVTSTHTTPQAKALMPPPMPLHANDSKKPTLFVTSKCANLS